MHCGQDTINTQHWLIESWLQQSAHRVWNEYTNQYHENEEYRSGKSCPVSAHIINKYSNGQGVKDDSHCP